MSSVRFNYVDVKPPTINNKKVVKEFVGDIFSQERKKLKLLRYIFCSDDYLLGINNVFLNHEFFTDIISFDLSVGVEIVGEAYISLDRVRENSIFHSTSHYEEFLRVVFHGALHLCGYKDKKKSEIIIMRQKEDYYLRLFSKKNW